MSHSDLCARCRQPRRRHIDTVAGLLCPTMRYQPAPAPPTTPAGTDSICLRCRLWDGRCGHWAEVTEPIRQPRCLGFVAAAPSAEGTGR
jgi:hypothetical protein